MAFNAKSFKRDAVTVSTPVKSSGDHDFLTCLVGYGADKLTIFTLNPSNGTRITENSKKPGQLTQGFHLEDKAEEEMFSALDRKLLEELLKHKGAKGMPEYISTAESVEELLRALRFIKYKPLLHRPKKKGNDGKPTKEVDMTIPALIYGNMIQCGPKHPETPNKVFTKYLDVKVLSKEVRDAIKAGIAKEDDYRIPAEAIFKRKCSMKCMWNITVGDIFISDSVLKIRRSINEVYIVSFEQGESKTRKQMGDELEAAGVKFDGPAVKLPDAAPEEDDDSDDDKGPKTPAEPVVVNPMPPPEAKKDFKISIMDGN
jgi:predicted house-cleaning noncanonical NTP pyrophosphatase (MazG superfamily)